MGSVLSPALSLLHNLFVGQIKDTSMIVQMQSLRWPLLAKFAAAVTLFAHTRMYLLLIPVIAWNLDPALGRRLIVLWALALYLANAMKNLLLLPRPRCLDNRVLNLLERLYEMRFLKNSPQKLDGRSLFSTKNAQHYAGKRNPHPSQNIRSPLHTIRKVHGSNVVINGAVAQSPSNLHSCSGCEDEPYLDRGTGGLQPQYQQYLHTRGTLKGSRGATFTSGGVGMGNDSTTSSDASKHNHKSYLASALGVAGDQHERLGLPCTRTLSATLLPAYLVLLTYATYGYSLPQATMLACTWALLVSFSRM